MLKQAFRSYLSSLHPRNIKKIKDNGNWFWILYWVVLYPLMMIKMIPFFLMGWSNLSSKFLMPKAMFLCPMKQAERREYINWVLLLKIGIPVLIGIGIELIWSCFYGFHIWQLLSISFIHFSVGVAVYICYEAPGRNDQNISFARKDKNGKNRWAWMNIVSMCLGILLLMGYELSDMTDGMTLGNGIVIGVGTGLLLLFDILIFMTQYRSTVEQAGDYELTFRVLSKVPAINNVEFDIFKK